MCTNCCSLDCVKQQRNKDESFLFKFFGIKKINERVITSHELANNFAGLVTSGLGPHVCGGRPVCLRRCSSTTVPIIHQAVTQQLVACV
jgi:hypothetical protein